MCGSGSFSKRGGSRVGLGSPTPLQDPPAASGGARSASRALLFASPAHRHWSLGRSSPRIRPATNGTAVATPKRPKSGTRPANGLTDGVLDEAPPASSHEPDGPPRHNLPENTGPSTVDDEAVPPDPPVAGSEKPLPQLGFLLTRRNLACAAVCFHFGGRCSSGESRRGHAQAARPCCTKRRETLGAVAVLVSPSYRASARLPHVLGAVFRPNLLDVGPTPVQHVPGIELRPLVAHAPPDGQNQSAK